MSPSSLANAESLRESYNKEDFVPESGLAKNRMKQYLETVTTSGSNNNSNESEELQCKGLAKSLLAKWKSMENVKDKEGSPEPNDASAYGRKIQQKVEQLAKTDKHRRQVTHHRLVMRIICRKPEQPRIY